MTNNMNSGYHGYSMSKRAYNAYADGEMPKSKWTKKAMLAAINEFADDNDLIVPSGLSKMKKDEIFNAYFANSSWHHTSMLCNETDFFALINLKEEFDHMTSEQIAAKNAAKKAAIAAKNAEKAELEEKLAASKAMEAEFEKTHGFAINTLAAWVEAYPAYATFYESKKHTPMVTFDMVAFAAEHPEANIHFPSILNSSVEASTNFHTSKLYI